MSQTEPIIFLYNKERIMLEGLELAKLKISQRMGLSKNIVEGCFIIKEGKVVPDFTIDPNEIPLKFKDTAESVVKEVWTSVSQIINERLSNLRD